MSFTYEKLAEVAFQIITFTGEAKSFAMLAIYAAKDKKFEEAKENIKKANENINKASEQHFDLIQKEASGETINVPLILMHAEDQLLSTQTLILMAEEMIDLHKKLAEK
ncbi:PTS lactose/cellobiose transporter subunit IIA [Malacoplasma iowae]|uniref:PTS system, cellobiose-specific, IIA component n=1 Tax=Malacoplasma iowae DK-CPA TaxID=1394179 RepID=A0A084U4I6_MALIO|nr:PTS lactose/cellobiose transporter subunit IIA [Malacoplasma iowae]KFB07872.1 PTS system, cellobiose-specific, IIA component [Malacoplasma iowae DK-CPA]WPL36561.1 PTS lactose/cellobiose transporter subunit IIA [Malacoplasma iowae]WPL38268.1 PTS lactose/cellobiose transporter subunit IIA [Malacoplasma iowae]WPL40259.1 PTS lactose/cellobiose transporter subunit IIA [Malacoplasma iowae]WPL41181.1 PTS lactose/cellobiose transporter subunit IIA [Malacoplasma iowae]